MILMMGKGPKPPHPPLSHFLANNTWERRNLFSTSFNGVIPLRLSDALLQKSSCSSFRLALNLVVSLPLDLPSYIAYSKGSNDYVPFSISKKVVNVESGVMLSE